ncbi:3-oxoacyl-[acyl-carrier-protein] reductase FabG-like [Plodia interpunctella]|uniref:3-oxoacyl-[acyl-carrier-protein] reductase FabG-like n=1 Tax=Plodia interpunctella TaxID=58824 RepID=UPI00236779C4|nr:3-oxoacyl-[acyl-carrier-protein] reductase FabG-like [Plodia interpunctella]
MSFKNKVVLVTGASSGIGAATAVLFAKEGADVVIVARNETKLKNVAQECAKVGKYPLVIKADVSDDDDDRRIINDTIAKFNKLDVLVNNAGILRFGPILDGQITEQYDEIMKTNVRSVVRLTSLAAPYLVKTKGNIVNVSSVAGYSISDKAAAYCTSKAALSHFSRASALELACHGVRVNAVSPGPVNTDIFANSDTIKTFEDFGVKTALNRVSGPEEIADLILFLASDKAKGITGSDYVSDNGYLLLK